MTEDKKTRRYVQIGIAAMAIGLVLGIVGALFAHFTGLPETDNLGRDLYPAIPRGWYWVTLGQIVSLTGGLLFIGGIAIGFLYDRPVTWARAAVGGTLFSALMIILFGIIPNEWLTLTQSVFEWTPQKIAFTIPPVLVLGNDVSVSYAAIKDIVSGTYSVVALGAVAVGMYQWQEWRKRVETGPAPEPVSTYGRPLTKIER